MVRSLRIASEGAVIHSKPYRLSGRVFLATSGPRSRWWPLSPCVQGLAFRLHDTNLERKDVSLRDTVRPGAHDKGWSLRFQGIAA